MISAIILTKNEGKNISKCINSLLWCDEIIIIDDYSTDRTVKIAKKLGVKVYKRHLNNNFSNRRNYGLKKAKNEWILFIDADEIVSKKLHREIITKIQTNKFNAYFIKRTDYFLGKELKHGETENIKLLRLAKQNSGKWKRKVHEYWDVEGKIGELNNPILHIKKNLYDFINNINNYSSIHALETRKENKKSNILKIIIWPVGKFLHNYIYRLGFLDGIEGLIMAVIMSFHSFLAWSKSWLD